MALLTHEPTTSGYEAVTMTNVHLFSLTCWEGAFDQSTLKLFQEESLKARLISGAGDTMQTSFALPSTSEKP